jgi:hypothetical protein
MRSLQSRANRIRRLSTNTQNIEVRGDIELGRSRHHWANQISGASKDLNTGVYFMQAWASMYATGSTHGERVESGKSLQLYRIWKREGTYKVDILEFTRPWTPARILAPSYNISRPGFYLSSIRMCMSEWIVQQEELKNSKQISFTIIYYIHHI